MNGGINMVAENEGREASPLPVEARDHGENATTVTTDVVIFTREKKVLLTIKCGFAFLWGFINTVIYLLSSRYATMMTGNLILLAIQAQESAPEEVVLTSVLILSYILCGACYDFFAIYFRSSESPLKIITFFTLIASLGIAADTIQYTTGSISSPSKSTGANLYFLAPISCISGLVASGYCSSHPDGIITTLLTGHVRVLPNTILKVMLTDGPHHKVIENAFNSVSVIVSYFIGASFGRLATYPIKAQYEKGIFVPVFTLFGFAMASVCVLHHNVYRNLQEKKGEESAEVNKVVDDEEKEVKENRI